jgi:putative signal transducing protein
MSTSSGEDLDIVPVLVTNDAAELAVAKSLLDAEGVECEVEGESGEETLGAGPLPGVTGPRRLMVARKDEEAARGLLAQQDGATDPDA